MLAAEPAVVLGAKPIVILAGKTFVIKPLVSRPFAAEPTPLVAVAPLTVDVVFIAVVSEKIPTLRAKVAPFDT